MLTRPLCVIILSLIILSACNQVELDAPTQSSEDPHPSHIQPSPFNEGYSHEQATSLIDRPEESLGESPAPLCPETESFSTNNFDVLQTPLLAEPAVREPFQDPIFGTCIIRVTDREQDLSLDDLSPGLKNEYSRVQSFNADGSLLLLYGTEGTWYLYDADTLHPIHQISIGVEPRWDAKDPDILYFIDETRLMSYNVSNAESKLLHDFSQDFPQYNLAAVWTKYEGSPSLDSRYWGLMAEDEDWMTAGYLIYDLKEDLVIALRELPDPLDVDSVTISPLGNYYVAFLDNACERNQRGSHSMPCGLMVYDSKLEEARGLLRIVGHSDLALDPYGNEVLVYQDIDTDTISVLDLASGVVTPLLSIDFTHSPIGLHFSGKAYNLPGWILVSTYSGAQPAATWMDDQIFALEIKPSGRVVRLAHTHSVVDEDQDHDYWAEPHATTSPDFTRILFTSNWGRSGTGEVETYLIELPGDWQSNLLMHESFH
jgi:hypothetical protein